jgi:hypothetical protein
MNKVQEKLTDISDHKCYKYKSNEEEIKSDKFNK